MAETRINEVDFPNLSGDLHALRKQFMNVRARLWQLEALFQAMGSLESLETCMTEELIQISQLVDMGRDVAGLGEAQAQALDDDLDKFHDRLFRQPVEGDAMPLEFLADMLETAALHEPPEDGDEMYRRVQLANTLKGYVAASEGTQLGGALGSALDAWLGMLDRQGAVLHLVPWASGYQEYRYNWKPGFEPLTMRRMVPRTAEAETSS